MTSSPIRKTRSNSTWKSCLIASAESCRDMSIGACKRTNKLTRSNNLSLTHKPKQHSRLIIRLNINKICIKINKDPQTNKLLHKNKTQIYINKINFKILQHSKQIIWTWRLLFLNNSSWLYSSSKCSWEGCLNKIWWWTRVTSSSITSNNKTPIPSS